MRHLKTVLTALTIFSLAPAVAHADAQAEAKAHFRNGVSLQQVEDFDAAIEAYESSLELYPTKSALFNLANCLKAAHRYADALSAFETLLAKHTSELGEAMRSAALEQIATLQPLTGTLTVVVSPQAAEILVDGQSIARSPESEPIRLSVGTHEVEARLDGFVPQRTTVHLKSQQSVTAKLTLEEVSPPVAASTVAAPAAPHSTARSGTLADQTPESESHGLATPGWLTAGLGSMLLLGGTATGLWAIGLDRSLDRDCPEGHCPASRIQNQCICLSLNRSR